jgi:hypothetical protein
MHEPNARRSGMIFGVAGAGLLLGHWLTYLVDVPSHARDDVLRATGHGYLSTAGRFAAVTAAVCLAVVFLGRLTRKDMGASFASIAGRLAIVQASAFVAMEVLERIGSGAPMHDLTAILPVGAAAQVMLALAGAWLLRVVMRAADVAGSLAGPLSSAAPRPVGVLAPIIASFQPRPLFRIRSPRGPPLPS